jgi:four helix bundle protein
MSVKSYRELFAWQKGMDFVESVYRITRTFPREEIYALTSQLRRAAVSIPSNIAEGQGRGVGNERVAQGSIQEAETQILIAERLRYVDAATIAPALGLADEVGKLTRALHQSVTSN